MDDLREQTEMADEIADVVATPISHDYAVMDEKMLLDELNQLMDEEEENRSDITTLNSLSVQNTKIIVNNVSKEVKIDNNNVNNNNNNNNDDEFTKLQVEFGF